MLHHFPNAKSWLRCMRCGKLAELYAERLFRCQAIPAPGQGRCGGLYDLIHDIGAVNPIELRKLIAYRLQPVADDPRTRSGVWQFHEIVMP